jgi:FKBP-type peptidyl-prolyl cis-trans isomerase (trigger factor)
MAIHTEKSNSSLNVEIIHSEPSFCSLSILVPAKIIDALYQQAVIAQKRTTPAFGFHKRETPTAYIEQNYQTNLVEHIQEFILKYLVISFLQKEIYHKKLVVAGQPRLKSVDLKPGSVGIFNFELSLFPAITFQEWKYLPFKAPKRKNYKDLDRQVETFLQEEINAKEKYANKGIEIGDWVNYSLCLLNNDLNPVIEDQAVNLWIKIGDEEPDKPFQELFVRKKNKEKFTSSSSILQDYFTDVLSTRYNFEVVIHDIVPNTYFCLDQFKQHFRIKSNKEMYQKLIEVFSYRNDLSQRRTMVEESLKLLFSKHRFEIPNHLILRQQKKVMDAIQYNPDYHVYRVQPDFKDAVRELAEKQAREEIFLTELAYEQGIEVYHTDIKNYLNLLKRARTKEFVHSNPPMTKIRGQEHPILNEELSRVCLLEKTLNHIIYHLTKK